MWVPVDVWPGPENLWGLACVHVDMRSCGYGAPREHMWARVSVRGCASALAPAGPARPIPGSKAPSCGPSRWRGEEEMRVNPETSPGWDAGGGVERAEGGGKEDARWACKKARCALPWGPGGPRWPLPTAPGFTRFLPPCIGGVLSDKGQTGLDSLMGCMWVAWALQQGTLQPHPLGTTLPKTSMPCLPLPPHLRG